MKLSEHWWTGHTGTGNFPADRVCLSTFATHAHRYETVSAVGENLKKAFCIPWAYRLICYSEHEGAEQKSLETMFFLYQILLSFYQNIFHLLFSEYNKHYSPLAIDI